MALDRLGEIVAALLIYAQSATGYPPPDRAPVISFLPHSELESKACGQPCQVFGWYAWGQAIYLDDSLDPITDLKARSILLHELVHYLQHANGAYIEESKCQSWAFREVEAYRVQGRWIAKQPNSASLRAPRMPPSWAMTCEDSPADAAGSVAE